MSRFLVTTGAIAVVLVAAACSSSSGDSTQATNSNAAKGKALKIGIMADVVAPQLGGGYPEIPEAAQAAVKAINSDGGVNGRPLSLSVCDLKGDPNRVTTCARQFAGDKSMIAVVGSDSLTGSPESILQAAGLAYFGSYPNAAPDWTNPVAFPIIGGPTVGISCSAQVIGKFIKAKTVSSSTADIPASNAFKPQIVSAMSAAGVKVSVQVSLPPTSSDLSAQVAAATKGVDAAFIGTSPALTQAFVQSAASSGSKTPIMLGVSLTPGQIKQLGSAADGLYGCASLKPPTNDFAGGKQYLKETASLSSTYQQNAADTSLNSWLATHMFAEAIKGVTNPTRATTLAALNKVTNLDALGFTGNLNATVKNTTMGGQFPRLFTRTSYGTKIVDGKAKLLQDAPITS